MKKSLYENVQNDIKQKIETGKLKKDEKLPSEDKLCKSYNVSKVTLRRALTNLIDEGYLYAQPRIGYFVSMPSNDGFVLQYDVEIACSEPISKVEVLDIGIEETVKSKEIKVVKAYYIDDSIAAVEFSKIKTSYSFKNQENKDKVLNYYKEITPEIFSYATKKELEIISVNGDEEVCNYLECFEDDPLLNVTVSYYDDYNKLFAYKSTYYLQEYAILNATMEKKRG